MNGGRVQYGRIGVSAHGPEVARRLVGRWHEVAVLHGECDAGASAVVGERDLDSWLGT